MFLKFFQHDDAYQGGEILAGHSKWANIKHRKARVDEKRAQIFTKISRELIVATKQGGSDPEANPRLKAVIQKARQANLPMDNINRVIQKASGEGGGANYEEVVYEGYGPGGVAIMLDILTDNRNRTAGEIRYIFSRNGGSLGENGCVAWMFEKKGIIVANLPPGAEEESVMLAAIEAGADDVSVEDGVLEITTAPEDLEKVQQKITMMGVVLERAETSMVPTNTVTITDPEQARQVLKLAELLEDHDDVQTVFANFDIPEEILAQIDIG